MTAGLGGAGLAPIGLGFVAGALSTLSPCVLPLLPLVVGSAVGAHRWGVAALAAGVALSFTVVGLFVATVGWSVGLDADWFRTASAVLLAVIGLVLVSAKLQAAFARAASGVSQGGHRVLGRMSGAGWSGQLAVGVVLGAVWSPCVGPTLGAASLLAAQGQALAFVAGVMLAFGIGAAVPLLAIGALSREAVGRWRGRIVGAGKAGRFAMGGGALLVALLILTGVDKRLETAFVDNSPEWLVDLTTRY